MLARITDNHFIYLDQVTPHVEESLIRWFSVRNPRAYFSRASAWDGWYRRYNTTKQRLALPFKADLIQCCEKNDIPLEIVDERDAPTYPAPQEDQITESLIDGITLLEYQVRCLKTACTEDIGIFNVKTGGGKTELMCGLIKMFRCPTVVITEQIVVLEQIVKRLTMRNVVHNNDIGLFCHGNMPDGNLVIIGSIQSLVSPKKPEPDDIRITKKKAILRCAKWIKENKVDENGEPFLYRVFTKVTADAIYDNPKVLLQLSEIDTSILIEYCSEIDYQRLLKWYKARISHAREIQEHVNNCDLMLVDEADLATSDMYTSLFRTHFKGRRRYGFSGTPFDAKKPVENLFLRERLGSIIAEAGREEIQAAGRIIPIKFYSFAIGPDNRDDCRAYDIAMKEEMIENSGFHALVAKIVSSFPKDGTLILVDTSPIEPLGQALENIIPNSKFILGKTNKKERRKYITAFENRELTCLIGSKILNRGLDLAGGVENLVIIGGGEKWSNFDQKIGRSVRVNKRGWARVFSFFFLNNKYLYKHSKENLKALVSMGYPAKVIINGVEIDGEKFIKSRFRIPRS